VSTVETIHGGHRQRMRERYIKRGLEDFAPHEVLEMLLFYTRPRGDVNPLAHALLEEFGSLHGVLEAAPQQLMCVPGMGEESAALLSMIVPVIRRYYASRAREKMALSNVRELKDYCIGMLSGLRSERFCVLLMDGYYRLLGVKTISEGSLDQVNACPRSVVEAALSHNASHVVLCHNHPSETLSPSGADVDATRAIKQALDGVRVMLLDHVIVAGGRAYSMAESGYLSNL